MVFLPTNLAVILVGIGVKVGIIAADIETDRVAAVRRQIPVLANRRPEAYRLG